MRYVSCLAACAALLAAAAPAPARPSAGSAPLLLAYRFTPGRTLRYEIAADIQGSVPLFNNPEPVDAHATITLVYKATPLARRPDGSTDIRLRVESVDAEVEKIPLPLPIEQAQKFLDQDITLSKTGEVTDVRGGGPLPFNVSIPGVDPKRLYVLLFPIVFQDRPVSAGDTWPFRSELLGGEGAAATFTATMLGGAKVVGRVALPPIRLGEKMRMTVDQKLDANRKPTTDEAAVHRTRQGTIDGSGTLQFDRTRGLFTSGVVDIDANLLEKVVGQPQPDEPKEVASKVKARVRVRLLPPAQPAPAARRTPRRAPRP